MSANHRNRGFVYVMRGLDSGLLKIGWSASPTTRLRSIAAAAEAVELIATVPGSEDDERATHRRFEAHRVDVRGREWFRNEGGVAAWLAALPAEHRASGTYRVRRRAPHYTPEQAEAMRRYWQSHAGPRGDRRQDEFYRQHRHTFVPRAYLEGCSTCTTVARTGVPAARNLIEALRDGAPFVAPLAVAS